jgi:outer membrane autotransporter protein
MFGVWVPVGYQFANGVTWFSKAYVGYADGEYKRITPLGRYSSDADEYQYGLGNEARYNMALGNGFTLSPAAELNLLGIYQKGFDEGNGAQALSSDDNNSLSLEGGLGAYLSKTFGLTDNSKLGIQIGGIYYVEFLDEDSGARARLQGLSDSYKLKNKSNDDRAVFSLRANYDYKNITLYGLIEQEFGGNDAFSFDLGAQYNF